MGFTFAVARAGHLNIGKKQPHVVPGFEQFQRGVCVRGFDDAKAVFFKRIGSDHAQKRLVFNYENQWFYLAHESRTNQPALRFPPTGQSRLRSLL